MGSEASNDVERIEKMGKERIQRAHKKHDSTHVRNMYPLRSVCVLTFALSYMCSHVRSLLWVLHVCALMRPLMCSYIHVCSHAHLPEARKRQLF